MVFRLENSRLSRLSRDSRNCAILHTRPAEQIDNPTMKATFRIAAACMLSALVAFSVLVDAAEAPCNRQKMLTIGGNIQKTNASDGTWVFDDDAYLALPQAALVTSTTWTQRQKFEGPLLRSVLAHVGAKGVTIRLLALNNYVVEIPVSDLKKFDPILAHSGDGIRLKRSGLGPLFLVYPRDQFSLELTTPLSQSKFIWQVCRIDIK
jgi:hypothetical protein